MLKRFLKFFKQEEVQPLPEFEGSYLDFLLKQIEPGVRHELELCPEHDPVLVVITQLLRVSMKGIWSEALRRPLLDAPRPQAPTSPPPPPAPPRSAPPARPADALPEVAQQVEVADEAVTQDEAPQASDFDAARDAARDDAPTPPDAEAARDEEHPTTVELEEGEAELLEDDSLIESSTASLEEETGPDALLRVDRKEVLQAGRVYLGMLIENDRLPPELQLGLEETLLARDLLIGYFIGNQHFEERAQRLLKIVEQKFSEGLFSQARILLQLFQTDRKTRIRNDRNIFYEDMIQRFGIRRRRPISQELMQQFKELTRAKKVGPDELTSSLVWMEHHLQIRAHLFVRQSDQVARWQQLAGLVAQPAAAESLMRYLPPRRWRGVAAHAPQPLSELVRAHLNADTLASYVINHMQTCYFVLRAVGDTGLEAYLDTFFDWTNKGLGCNATLVLPELYRRSMGDTDLMRAIFQDLYDRTLREAAEQALQRFDEAAIEAATREALRKMSQVDVNQIAPGNYNLGGFVYDQLFKLNYPSPEFAFKVHRLT